MTNKIGIEQHEFVRHGDEVDLFEITHLDKRSLQEFDDHLTLSPIKLSDHLAEFHKTLKRLLASLDMRQAS